MSDCTVSRRPAIAAWLVLLPLLLLGRHADAASIDPSMLTDVRALLTTAGDPNDGTLYGTPLASGYDGVGALLVDFAGGGQGLCSASRIGPRQVLTAAHCFTDDTGMFITASAEVGFFPAEMGGTILGFPVSSINIHPGWNGELLNGNDLAVLELAETPPPSVDVYGLFTDPSNDLGSIFNKVGFGASGNGNDGEVLPAGTRRQGDNTYEATIGDSILLYDFDNGDPAQNSLALIGVLSSLGLGDSEVLAAGGDSGGPSFINGLIAGITSFGARLPNGDIDSALNATFGELGGDTRVTSYLDFITSFLDTQVVVTVAEPSALAPFAVGLGFLLLLSRRQRRDRLFGRVDRRS